MNSLRCLYVDDTPAHQARYARSIEIAWLGQGMSIPIEIVTVASPEEALKRLQESEFSLLIVDVLYKENKEQLPLGLHLINTVRQDRRWKDNLAIIALSIEGQWYKDAMNNGADEFLPKQFIDNRDARWETLGETLVAVLKKRGHDPVFADSIEVVFDQADIRVIWLIEWIGKKTIGTLSAKLLKASLSRVGVGFVRSGLSGAAVLRLDCSLKVEEGAVPDERKILLKTGRDRKALSDELEKLEKVRSRFPSSIFVPAVSHAIEDSNGWHGIALEFLDHAKTFRDWVIGPPSIPEEKIGSGLSGLLLEGGLADVYGKFSRREPPSVAFRAIVTPSRAAAVLLSLEELLPLVRRYDTWGLFDESLLREYLRPIGSSSRGGDAHLSSYSSLAHGDLHSGNILVNRSGSLRLVDAGSICELPWPADVARLVVDLIVTCWDFGADSHDWVGLVEWISLIEEFLTGSELSGKYGEKNSSVCSVLAWIRINLAKLHPEVFGSQAEYEFRLAVAIELIRSSYRRQDLSAPKRVLGLVGFCIAMRSSNGYFDENLKR